MTKIYGIINKDTKEFKEFNRKSCWMTTGAAKSSYRAATSGYDRETRQPVVSKFDDQITYEIVELTEIYHMYQDLCE